MPYLLDEQQGILKMVIHHISNEDYPVVYEVVDINPRQVSDEEISIMQSEPKYSYPEDSLDQFYFAGYTIPGVERMR